MSLLERLKSRGVLRVALAYLAAAWLILQLAEILFPAYGFGDAAIRNLVVLLAAGLVVVVAFSWFFEWTASGIVSEEALERGERAAGPAPPARTHRTLNRFTVLVLTLAVAFFVVDKFVFDPARDRAREQEVAAQARAEALERAVSDKSIAVLPFRDLSPGGNQAHLSEGVSEEVLNLLARIPQLRVAGRASSFAMRDSAAAIPDIGERLSVAYVLDGSVSRSGSRVRVNAQLVDVKTDTQLWSERYDRELNDLFALQDEIAARVVQELRLRLVGELPRARVIGPEAYEKFLEARYLLHEFDDLQAGRIKGLLLEVLEAEPDYTPALGQYWNLLIRTKYMTTENVLRSELEDVVRRMLEADPDSADTLRVQAEWLVEAEGDLEDAAAALERALEVDPGNLDVLRIAVYALQSLEQYDDAITVAKRLVLREPSCGRCFNALGNAFRGSGRYREGALLLEEIDGWSDVPRGFYWNLGVLWLNAGEPRKALDAWERESTDVGEVWRLLALHDLGRNDEFEARFEAMRADPEQHPESIARVYAYTGNADRAFEWLAKMMDPASEVNTVYVGNEIYDPIKDDPRWDPLMLTLYGDDALDPPPDIRLQLPPELGGPG